MVVELVAAGVVPAGVVHAAPAHRALEARARRHVGLGTDDRRDPLLPALLVEVQHAVHVAVVGDGKSRLTVSDGGRDHVADTRGAVEHRVLGVGVEVCEGS